VAFSIGPQPFERRGFHAAGRARPSRARASFPLVQGRPRDVPGWARAFGVARQDARHPTSGLKLPTSATACPAATIHMWFLVLLPPIRVQSLHRFAPPATVGPRPSTRVGAGPRRPARNEGRAYDQPQPPASPTRRPCRSPGREPRRLLPITNLMVRLAWALLFALYCRHLHDRVSLRPGPSGF